MAPPKNKFLTWPLDIDCRFTNYSLNPEELGYKPNEPNTINL